MKNEDPAAATTATDALIQCRRVSAASCDAAAAAAQASWQDVANKRATRINVGAATVAGRQV